MVEVGASHFCSFTTPTPGSRSAEFRSEVRFSAAALGAEIGKVLDFAEAPDAQQTRVVLARTGTGLGQTWTDIWEPH